MHALLSVFGCSLAIVCSLEVGFLFRLDGLKILGSVFDIVESLFFFKLSLCLAEPSTKAKTLAIAVEIQAAVPRAIDVSGGFIRNLPAMCATIFHAPYLLRFAPSSATHPRQASRSTRAAPPKRARGKFMIASASARA
jgi:hypothetical protein